MSPTISVSPSKTELVQEALERVCAIAQDAIQKRDRFTIALAGGNTPKPLYEKLAKTDQDWEKWHIFWGDERFVPSTHPDSNERMASVAWLNHVPIPSENIHPLNTQFSTPQEAAQNNEAHLKQVLELNNENSPWPSLDLTLLGMGDDGHTASLFPDTAALKNHQQWVTVGMKGNDPRLTLTVPVLNQSQNIIFLIAGENKNPVLKEIFGKTPLKTSSYPVQLIQPIGQAYWLLDDAAAQNIHP